MKLTLVVVLTALAAFMGHAQQAPAATPDSINQRIYLIGDAGEMKGNTHPVIDWLKKNVDWNEEKNSVIFLGDNIYPNGMPYEGDPDYLGAKRIIDYQISLVKGTKSRAYFIPGNHDWRNGKLGGWDQVMNQQDYINSIGDKNIQAWPINGCPGPIEIEVTDKVVFALIDTEWFLYLHDKPGPGSNCQAKTIDEFETELREIAASHPNQLLVVATHHPVFSYSVHGGDYTWKEHLFPFTALNKNLYIPLPVLGSVYPLARGVFGSVQDIKHPLYRTIANVIEDVIKTHPHPIVVSGHDHCLQMIAKDSVNYIVSGAGAKMNRVHPGKYELFSDVVNGFALIEVWKSGKMDVKFYNILSNSIRTPTFTTTLDSLTQVEPPARVDTTRPLLDSIKILAANPELEGNGIKRFLTGKSYRREWTEPIKVRVLDMGEENGGLTPVKQGGGKQTKSLRVVDKSGKEWALRSIVKNPTAAIPADLQQTFVRDIVNDGVAASYPYGALSMGTLSKAAGVPYLRNKLVYLPDDPRLQRFNNDFKNTMALMEEREPPDVQKTDNTDEVVLKLAKDNDDHIDQRSVLKIRLLDNFVMDFDRHEGQWLWATRDTGKGKIYYAIPKDRDQAFFVSKGLLPSILKKPWLVPELQGFKAKADNIKTFNRTARNFDRTFLNELPAEVWKLQIDSFLNSMTDSVIETALRRQPPEIQKYSVEKIIEKLKKRRQYFSKEMDTYYKFLSRIVTVIGTNQREQFQINKMDDGKVQVIINKIAKDSSISSKIYDRVFDPGVTKQVWIYGLNDDDRFIVTGSSARIKVRIVGGSGNDEFINNATGGRVLAYDASFEKNTFSGTGHFRKTVVADPQVNRYSRLNFKYNFFHPALRFEYNVDDGVFLGAQAEYFTQGFRKEPYSVRQYASASRAFKTGSLHFQYEADFIRAIGDNDLLIRADFRAPVNVTNFFGLGNETRLDKNKNDWIQYYRARYDISNVTVYLRKQYQSWLRVNLGPSFQYFTIDSSKNQGRYVDEVFPTATKSDLFARKTFLGADARLNIDNKNNAVMPTRGFVLDAGIRPLFGMNDKAYNLVQANVDMRIFMSLASKTRLVLATRFGWGTNYGNYEFPQAMYLGGTDNLRGYRKQRFAGRSMLFNNTELRIKLFEFSTYLFPGSFGILIFNDVGKVYVKRERSTEFHFGYGGGIWIAPIRRFVVTVMGGHSKEETLLPRVTFGYQF